MVPKGNTLTYQSLYDSHQGGGTEGYNTSNKVMMSNRDSIVISKEFKNARMPASSRPEQIEVLEKAGVTSQSLVR